VITDSLFPAGSACYLTAQPLADCSAPLAEHQQQAAVQFRRVELAFLRAGPPVATVLSATYPLVQVASKVHRAPAGLGSVLPLPAGKLPARLSPVLPREPPVVQLALTTVLTPAQGHLPFQVPQYLVD